MIDISQILEETFNNMELVCESTRHKVPHIFDDENLTFGEIRDMIRKIFSGSTELLEKIDGLNIEITFKDGGYKFARNKGMLKDPIDYRKLGSQFDGCPKLHDAFVNSAIDLEKALNSISPDMVEKIFNNGKNFLNIDIVYPPARNIMDYGNKCILQLNSIDVYDDKFNKVSEDEEAMNGIYEIMKNHNALKQEMFEISKPNVLRIKDSVDSDEACEFLINDLDQLVDGIGYKATIQDYVNSRLKKYIVNCAMKHGIDVGLDSNFVAEMSNRISYISHKRPTKTDLVYCAKKDGLNPRSQEYADLFNCLHNTSDQINEEIMKPIHHLVIKTTNMLFKNLIGFMAADPNKNTQRIVGELDETIKMVESDDQCLTPDKMRRFHKHLKKLQDYGDERLFPAEGVVFKYTTSDGRSKAYKLIGNFGSINQIFGLLRK